ncbi:hypothetical protein MMC22_009113 [Lobaria immixta]|nr:hypothetical protein [Lobaria immixta]
MRQDHQKKLFRHSLPGRAGGMNIVYHDCPTPYGAGTVEKGYSRLLEPSELVQDDSDYLCTEPRILSPGACLASAVPGNSGLSTSTCRTTTAGIMLQRGSERLISISNHGFELADEVYHPTPLGRKIGQIVERLPGLGIGLVSLDPSISFSNERYFQAPAPRQMISHALIKAGDSFEMDGISTGRIDLIAVGKSFYIEDPAPLSEEHDPADVHGWRIELNFSTFGPTGQGGKRGRLWRALCAHGGKSWRLFSEIQTQATCLPTVQLSTTSYTARVGGSLSKALANEQHREAMHRSEDKSFSAGVY